MLDNINSLDHCYWPFVNISMKKQMHNVLLNNSHMTRLVEVT